MGGQTKRLDSLLHPSKFPSQTALQSDANWSLCRLKYTWPPLTYALRPHHLGDISVRSWYLQKLHYIKNVFTLWEIFWPAWNFHLWCHDVWIPIPVSIFTSNCRNCQVFPSFWQWCIVILYDPFFDCQNISFYCSL